MRRLAAALFLAPLLALATPAGAQDCRGTDLIAALPAPDRAALEAAANAVPYPEGILWQAERAGQLVHLVGTYHVDDPRHSATLAQVAPLLNDATALLVEAGPEAEAALKDRLMREPALMIITEGPTLPQLLPPEVWDRLVVAMQARGVPGIMAAKFRPWYLSMMLSMSSCNLASAAAGGRGLDGLLMDAATARGIPLRDLEPYDTIFTLFDLMSQEEQLSMVMQALETEAQSDDMATTLAEAYFSGKISLLWEFTKASARPLPGQTAEEVAQDFAAMEEAMVLSRNRAWIAVIEEAAQAGPVVAAFGALHLHGPEGVLNLLAGKGWTIRPL